MFVKSYCVPALILKEGAPLETQWAADYDSASIGRRVGALLEGSPDGYRAAMRIFWADSANDETEVTLSPLETHIDLRGGFSGASGISGVLSGDFVRIDQPDDPAMNCLQSPHALERTETERV
jgi:hypothetical protein